MNFDEFSKKLTDKCAEIGLDLIEREIKQFFQLLTLYNKWSERMNLSSIHDENEIIDKHFVDSLFGSSLVNKNDKLADMGSGAGFPGLPLKIVRPEIKLGLFERREKKATYLKHVVRTLRFSKTTVYQRDVGDETNEEIMDEGYTVVMMRAVKPTLDLIKALQKQFPDALLYIYAGLDNPFQNKTLLQLPFEVAKEGFINSMKRTIFSLNLSKPF